MSSDGKNYFTARWLEVLDQSIRTATNSPERNVMFAKRAFGLARHSLILEANKIIKDLRVINAAYEPRLSAWIMFAEGVTEHSATLDIAKSRDRIFRAHLIGQVAKDAQLAATSAAWIAHFDFVTDNLKSSCDYISTAFKWSTDADTEARSRACLVFGMAFAYSGDLPYSKKWFQRARDYAVTSGDIAMQNIVLFNASALHVASLTITDCLSAVDPTELKFAVMSAQSVANLNNALGIHNLPSMIPLQRAELHVIQKNWQEAIKIVDERLESLSHEGQSRLRAKYIAQRAWCRANSGDAEGARSDVEIATRESSNCVDPDDRFVLHSRIASTALLIGVESLQEEHEVEAHWYLTQHKNHQLAVSNMYSAVIKDLSL